MLVTAGYLVACDRSSSIQESPKTTDTANRDAAGRDDTGAEKDGSDSFERPSSAYAEYHPIFDRLPEGLSPGTEQRESEALYGSPSIHPNASSSEAWLKKNQKAVFRYGYVGHGDVTEGRFRIHLLVNFKPVPFGIIKATNPRDSSLPSDDEMRQLEERSMVHYYQRTEGEKFGMGIVVDSDVFQLGKTNELRVLFIEDGVSDPSSHGNKYAKLSTRLPGMLVHYAGESPIRYEPLQKTTRFAPSPLRRLYLIGQPEVFLESEKNGAKGLEEWRRGDGPIPDLRNLTEVDSTATRIQASLVGEDEGSKPVNYYVSLYDYSEETFEPLGLVQDLADYRSLLQDDPAGALASRFEHQVEVGSDVNRGFVVFQFNGWFNRNRERPSTNQPDYKYSNTLWLNHTSR
jgi:hypothetical protein